MSKNTKGALYMTLACICFSTAGVMFKYISWSAISSNGVRTFIAACMFLIYMKLTGKKLIVNKTVVSAAVCVMLTTVFFALSNKLTTAANAIILQFTAPVFIILYTAFIKRAKPKRAELLTCVAVFAGLILFFFDSMSTGHYLGDLFGILAGVAYAGVFILNTESDSDAPSAIVIGYFVCALLSIPFIAFETDFSARTLLMLVCLGVFQLGAGYKFFTLSLPLLGAIPASLMSGLEPVLNPLLTALFYPEEKPGVFSLCGAAVVLASILAYNVAKALQESKNVGKTQSSY